MFPKHNLELLKGVKLLINFLKIRRKKKENIPTFLTFASISIPTEIIQALADIHVCVRVKDTLSIISTAVSFIASKSYRTKMHCKIQMIAAEARIREWAD